MHFVVAWDIKESDPRKTEIENNLRSSLDKYSWIGALPNLYILKADSQEDYDLIKDRLVDVAKKHSPNVTFISTPLMNGGKYTGFLPPNLWPAITELTK